MDRYRALKKGIHKVLMVSHRPWELSWIFDVFIITLIIFNVIAIVLESVQSIRTRYESTFDYFEVFTVVVFTIEYFLRIWTANLIPRFKHSIRGRTSYIFTPLAIVDLISILPFYLPFVGVDLRFMRIMRIFGVFRLLKIARYLEALHFIGRVVSKKREELLVSMFLTTFLLVIASTLMYYVENAEQPEAFSSIPSAMWWGIVTITTVGYGDVYPITPLGRVLGGIIAIIGIGLVALPTGILASGFSEEIALKRSEKGLCATCGRPFESSKTVV